MPAQRLTEPAGAVPTVIVATSPHNLRCGRQPSSILGGRVRSGSQNRPYVNLHTPLMLPIVPSNVAYRLHTPLMLPIVNGQLLIGKTFESSKLAALWADAERTTIEKGA